jgi:hypothetical protein
LHWRGLCKYSLKEVLQPFGGHRRTACIYLVHVVWIGIAPKKQAGKRRSRPRKPGAGSIVRTAASLSIDDLGHLRGIVCRCFVDLLQCHGSGDMRICWLMSLLRWVRTHCTRIRGSSMTWYGKTTSISRHCFEWAFTLRFPASGHSNDEIQQVIENIWRTILQPKGFVSCAVLARSRTRGRRFREPADPARQNP